MKIRSINPANNLLITEYIVSIDKLESISGIDFFFALPDSIENKIERKVNLDLWLFSN